MFFAVTKRNAETPWHSLEICSQGFVLERLDRRSRDSCVISAGRCRFLAGQKMNRATSTLSRLTKRLELSPRLSHSLNLTVSTHEHDTQRSVMMLDAVRRHCLWFKT